MSLGLRLDVASITVIGNVCTAVDFLLTLLNFRVLVPRAIGARNGVASRVRMLCAILLPEYRQCC